MDINDKMISHYHLVAMERQLKTDVRIGTHDGTFHCDEVLACVFLKMLPEYRDAEIVRTRDPELLSQCDVVVDVGGVFDHDAKRYDHHQATFDLTMKQISEGKIDIKIVGNVQLSSAGLIYWFYRKEIFQSLLPSDPDGKPYSARQMLYAFEFIYNQLVREIDFIDNGVHDGTTWMIRTSISGRVGHLRPQWDDPDQDMDKAFFRAFDMVKNELMGYIPRLHSHLGSIEPLKDIILERFDHHKSGSVLWFENGKTYDWQENLLNSSKEVGVYCKSIFYVVTNHIEQNRVTLKFTKNCPKDKKFPKGWSGLLDADLEKASGIEGLWFVHKCGHIAAGRKDAILKLIDKILY